MRKALVTLFGAGLITSLLLASCVVKEDDEDTKSSVGGTVVSSGGAVVSKGGAVTKGGAPSTTKPTGNGGTTASTSSGNGGSGAAVSVAQECPELLKTLDPGSVGACSTSNVAATFSQINMLIVMDKSGSMTQTPTGFASTKWVGAVESLKAALDPTETLVQYGLLMYPKAAAASSCDLDASDAAVNIPVGKAADKVPAITDLMGKTTPGGGTPTAAALQAALDYYTIGAGVVLLGQRYVLLVTDGGPNCNANVVCGPETCTANLDRVPTQCGAENGIPNCCDISVQSPGGPNPQTLCLDDLNVITKIAALASAGIKTFVVGIPGSEAYADYLDKFALAGGAPVTDATKTRKYYEVTDQASLTQAFKTITTSMVKSCVIPLKDKPLDTSNINVAIDCEPIPRTTGDVANWHYDQTQQAIVVEGTQCTRIQTTGVKRMDVVLGCPPYVAI